MSGIMQMLVGAVVNATDAFFEYVTLLLPGDGTNGAQNNTYLDSSSNAFTITRSGNVAQGTFSPFSQTGWSGYFDGTANGSLRADSSADTNLSADFTIQAWVFPTANGQSSNSEIMSRGAATTLNGWHFLFPSGTTQPCFQVNYVSLGNTSTSIQSSTNVPLNQWTHIAVTRSGNTAKIYINGSLDTTNTGFTTSPTVSGTEYVYVGRASYDTTNRQFTGYVSNASIIKGTALTTFNTTTPLSTSTSGQSLLTCTSWGFLDTNTATTAKAITSSSGASVQAFSPFNPTAAWSAATNGGSGFFDGSGDYLSVANNAALDMASTFSLEFWIYRTNGNDQMYVARGGGAANWNATNGYQYACFISSGTFYFQFNSGGSAVALVATATLPALNAWTHVAVARDGTTMRIWINGTSVGTSASSPTVPSTTNLTYIGQDIAGGSFAYAGYLSGYRFLKNSAAYDASQTTITVPTAPLIAITNTSLLLNFTNAGIYDATSKNDLETVGNAQISTAQSKWGGGSIAFDGTGDYLTSNPSASNIYAFGTGDFTIEFWLRLGSVSGNQSLVDIRPTGTNGLYPLIYASTTSLVYYVDSASRISGGTLSTGTWYHIAVARSGTSTKLFLDGTQIGSTYTDSNNYLAGSGAPWIGAFRDGTGALNGYINDLRITKGVARYTANFTPPTAAFPLY